MTTKIENKERICLTKYLNCMVCREVLLYRRTSYSANS